MRVRLRRSFQLLAVMILAVAMGCSGEPPEGASVAEDTTTASQSQSTAPSLPKTASPSSTPTSKPTGDVEQQLHAATEAFYAAVTKAYQTLDPAPIKVLVWPNTQAGDGYVNAIEDLNAKDYRFVGEPTLTISDFRMAPRDADPNSESVFVTVTSSDTTTVDQNGKIVDQHEGGSSDAKIQFMKMGDRWLVLSQHFED
jgi:hypothetical protein